MKFTQRLQRFQSLLYRWTKQQQLVWINTQAWEYIWSDGKPGFNDFCLTTIGDQTIAVSNDRNPTAVFLVTKGPYKGPRVFDPIVIPNFWFNFPAKHDRYDCDKEDILPYVVDIYDNMIDVIDEIAGLEPNIAWCNGVRYKRYTTKHRYEWVWENLNVSKEKGNDMEM
jgi:hypothetical protein